MVSFVYGDYPQHSRQGVASLSLTGVKYDKNNHFEVGKKHKKNGKK